MLLAPGRLLAGVIVTGLLAGCSSPMLDLNFLIASERRERVREAAESYGRSLRWGQVAEAAAHVAPPQRRAFLAWLTDTRTAPRFTLFELHGVTLGPEKEWASVRVSFEFYQPASLTQRTVIEEQVWHYDRDHRSWYVEPDLTLFGVGVGAGAGRPGAR